MKMRDVVKLQRAAERYDAICKFEAMEIASISIVPNPIVSEELAGEVRRASVRIAIYPDNPNFPGLLDLISDRIRQDKKIAKDELMAAGITPEADVDAINRITAATDRQKELIANAPTNLAAMKARKAASS